MLIENESLRLQSFFFSSQEQLFHLVTENIISSLKDQVKFATVALHQMGKF